MLIKRHYEESEKASHRKYLQNMELKKGLDEESIKNFYKS